jgi:hypothetical protein
MSTITESFTPEQILFIESRVFDTLSQHFDYTLGTPKRRACLAKAFEASNFDALLQRAKTTSPKMINPGAALASAFPEMRKSVGLNTVHLSASDMILLQARHDDEDDNLVMARETGFTLILSINDDDPLVFDERNLDVHLSAAAHQILRDAFAAGARLVEFDQEIELSEYYPDMQADNPNDNCLKGMRCPSCGEFGAFSIETEGVDPESTFALSQGQIQAQLASGELAITRYMTTWFDDGSQETAGDTDFVADGACQCVHCQHEGVLAQFVDVV